ncbi:BTAD domain-containing putative transcriptional regulator [Streptomyces sp. NPDC056402]|uniref:AfsR/SARP family transcriptional regulator n=1 Tax=Streptomyces sp. NPDC056402 TaxID=3345810 RepID=UPI0035DC3C0E
MSRTHTGYVLELERDQVDLTQFQDLWARARQAHGAGDAEAAHELAERAYGCWRGPLLAGEPLLPHHPAAMAAARQRVESLLLYTDLSLQVRRPERVLGALRGATEEEPLHEGLQARLMLVLASCGEQREALKIYSEVARGLDRELGVQPGDELRRAHLRILHQQLPWPRTGPAAAWAAFDAPAAPPVRPAAPPARPRPSQTPAASTGFVGRTAELKRLDRLLLPTGERVGQVPAVLVTGFPGVGKTALAVRWAHRVRERFPDGQLYVDLHGYADRRALHPQEALASFLRALGVPDGERGQPGRAEPGLDGPRGDHAERGGGGHPQGAVQHQVGDHDEVGPGRHDHHQGTDQEGGGVDRCSSMESRSSAARTAS